MALRTAQRDRLPNSDFALPHTRQFPIPDEKHARLALEQMTRESPKDQRAIARAVATRYPGVFAAHAVRKATKAAARRKPPKSALS